MGLLARIRRQSSDVTPHAGVINVQASAGSSVGYTTVGSIPLVGSQGVQRWGTYRFIYQTNPWVYASVNLIARGMARLPIHVFENDGEGRPTRIRGDLNVTPGRMSGLQKLDQLLSNGYGGKSRQATVTATYIDRLVYGNALWRILRDPFGQPSGFRRIRWRDVIRVIPDADGEPMAYEYRPWNGWQFGPVTHLWARDVIHFGLGSDPEGLYGMSPLESCRSTISLHEALYRHLTAYFENSARPSGFAKMDRELTPEQAKNVESALKDLYASPENAGKILGLAGTDWQEMGDAPDQSSVIDLIKLSREETVAVYHVPPPVAGILDQAIKSNVKELREQFGRDAVGPWASDFEGEIAAQLLPQQPSWARGVVKCDFSEFLRPDLESLSLVIQRIAPNVTPDEIRVRFLGMEALNLEGLSDVPWAARATQPMSTFSPLPESTPTDAPAPDADTPPADTTGTSSEEAA